MAGIIHVDNQYSDSFTYDAMEPVRPCYLVLTFKHYDL